MMRICCSLLDFYCRGWGNGSAGKCVCCAGMKTLVQIPGIHIETQAWPYTLASPLEAGRDNKGLAGSDGCQPSSKFREKSGLKGIKRRNIGILWSQPTRVHI